MRLENYFKIFFYVKKIERHCARPSIDLNIVVVFVHLLQLSKYFPRNFLSLNSYIFRTILKSLPPFSEVGEVQYMSTVLNFRTKG